MQISEVNQKLSEVNDLPTLPIVANKVISLVDNPKTRAADITSIVKQDPSLTARVMKLVNSAYYGFPREIATITHAIMILGFKDIKNLVLSASVFQMFNDNHKLLDKKALWEHSIGAAIICKLFAKRVKFHDPEEAFVVGLLHDMGKVVLEMYWPKEYEAILEEAANQNVWIRDVEYKHLNVTHSEIGYVLLDKWNLPKSVCRSIKFHHQIESVPEEYRELTYLCNAADIFARIKKIGNSGDSFIPSLNKEVWNLLKLNPEKLLELYKEIDEEMKKASSFLNIE